MTPKELRSKCLRYLAYQLVVFVGAAIGIWALFSAAVWTSNSPEAQVRLIGFVLECAGYLCAFTALFLAFSIAGWPAAYGRAQRDLRDYQRDPRTYAILHRDAFGPFPWR